MATPSPIVSISDNPGSNVLISIDTIDRRVRQLGREIAADYAQKDLVVISVLASGLIFTADLIRAIDRPLEIGFVRATSYLKGEKVPVKVEDFLPDRVEVGNRHVLIVDGISESGDSLAEVQALLERKSPPPLHPIKKCVFAIKRRASTPPEMLPDYGCFTIPDCLVVGYGINHLGRYRNLPNLQRIP